MWYMYYPDLKSVNNLPFYTVSIGLHVWQWPVSRNEGYPYPQFLYSEHGHGILDIYGEKTELPEHSVFFLPANVPHSYYPQTDRWDVRWFVPAGSGVTDLLHTFGFDRAMVYPLRNAAALDDIHNKIHMAFQLNTPESIFYSASYTYEYLFEFYKQYQQQSLPASVSYRKRLLPVLEYIEHHYADPPDAEGSVSDCRGLIAASVPDVPAQPEQASDGISGTLPDSGCLQSADSHR